MAGYAIHIAIAKEYLKKHNGYNEEEFIKGTIYPDTVKDKTLTHFSNKSANSNLKEFLGKYSIQNSYYAGWFLHLIVNREFYQSYLNNWDQRKDANREILLQDYDILNKEIMEKYEVTFPKEIQEYAILKEGELTYIKRETIFDFIEKMSKINLEDYELLLGMAQKSI